MKILTGLFEHMVVQRSGRQGSDAAITGEAAISGLVTVMVRTAKGRLRGFEGKIIGHAAHGKFTARLKGLPAGGPYTITLTVTDKKSAATENQAVKDVLVGDVWVVAGQSNAEGCGLLADRAKPHPMTRAFYMDDHWDVAEDPINCLAISVDQVHADLCGGTRPSRNMLTGVGPAVAFGQHRHRVTGVPQGVIASAHGGTSMRQWDPAKKSEGSRSLYGATLRRVAKNGGKIAGIIWYQGESECNPTDAPLYTQRMKTLVSSFRKDLRQPTLPFVCVQLSRFVAAETAADTWWEKVRDDQHLLPGKIKHFATVPAIDLTLDDIIHISGRDQQGLGRRLAQAALAIQKHPKSPPPPITLRRVTSRHIPTRGLEIVVEFDHVMGELQTVGRPFGFYLLDQDGKQWIYNTRLDGSRVILYTTLLMNDLLSVRLFYGAGTDPFCNIRDSGGRSLPAFGPIWPPPSQAITAFPKVLEVSALQSSAEKLHPLGYPEDLTALGLACRSFTDRFTHLHPELAARAPEDVLVYFRYPIECPEAMSLEVLLGYDGPVKLWIDGQERFFDPDGINPAIIDHRRIPFSATAGTHEILVALGSNHGRAWGIFLRLVRKDVPKSLLRKGPPAYIMPRPVIT